MRAQVEVSDVAAVRTAGLPSSVADRLTFDRSGRLMASILDADQCLERDGARLADALHAVIGEETDTGRRRRLVALRRALFTGRGPRPGEWDDDLAGRLPAELADGIARWARDHGRAVESRDRLETCLADERAEKSRVLLDAARTAPFPRAVAMASPDLLDEIRRWASHPDRAPKSAKLSRLAVYLVRAAVKTSPFGYFALSRLACWTDDDAGVAVDGDTGRTALEADAEYLDLIARSLAARPEVGAALSVRPNPSAVTAGDRIEFLGRPPREAICAVPATPALREAMKIVAAAPGAARHEVVDMLADAADGDRDAAARYLARMLDAGLVETRLPVPDDAPDWLGACSAWLDAHAGTDLTGVRGALATASEALRRPVPRDDVDRHRARCADVCSALTAAATELGVPEEDRRPPVLFENAVAGSPARLGRGWWRPVLDDLSALRPWLGLFDVHLPKRVAAARLHAERFGPGSEVELLTLYRAIAETVAAGPPGHRTPAERAVVDAFGPADPTRSQDAMLSASPVDELRELYGLRVRARAGLDAAADDDGVVRLDRTGFVDQVRGWPGWLEPPTSAAFYVQPCPDDGAAVVLNTAHGGHGRGTARLRHLLGDTGRPCDDGAPGDGRARVAALAGRHGSTLNVRAASTSGEIAYPFATGSGVDRGDVPLADLVAVHHRVSGTLGLRRAGSPEPVLPAVLGLMSTEYLPPAARFLTQVFGTDWLYHPGALTFVPFERLGPDVPVVSFPRLAIGRVTIRRAGSLMAAGEVPRREPGERDAAFLLRLGRWFRRHGIPERCVVRTWLPGADGQGEAQLSRRRTRSAKPLPYDLANGFLTPALERLVADASLVLFEERLPGPESAVRIDGQPHVVEVVVELTAGGPR